MTTDVTVYQNSHTAVAYVDGAPIPVVVGGDVGPTGAVGPAGPQGVQGVPGKSVLNGTAPPTGGVGADGDFYIDTTADAIYGPKTAGAWGPPTSLIGPQGATGATGATGADSTVPGPQGPQGVPGPRGYSVLNGTAPPSGATGVDGDFYIDTTADAIYGPKTGGAWGSPTSLVGPQGPQGIQGVQGLPGAGSTSDLAYGPAWDGVVNVSPSQNAVYDKIQSLGTGFLPLTGGALTGALSLSYALPVLTLKDTDSVGNASIGFTEFRDSANTRYGFVGKGNGTSADMLFNAEQATGAVRLLTQNVERGAFDANGLTVTPKLTLNNSPATGSIRVLDGWGMIHDSTVAHRFNIGAVETGLFHPGGLTISGTASNTTLDLVNGDATYSNIKMRGRYGGAALGLDILAGGQQVSFSCDAFTFRNAAQSANFATLGAAGTTLAVGLTVNGNTNLAGSTTWFGASSGGPADHVAYHYATNYYHIHEYHTASGGALALRAKMIVTAAGFNHDAATHNFRTLAGTTTLAAIDAAGLAMGNATPSGGATPIRIDLGATFSDVAGDGARAKLKLFNDGGAVYGLGVSSGQFDYMAPAGATHNFYVGGTKIANFTNDGQLGIISLLDCKTPNAGTTGGIRIRGNPTSGYAMLQITA
jgi:hypothetical protein